IFAVPPHILLTLLQQAASSLKLVPTAHFISFLAKPLHLVSQNKRVFLKPFRKSHEGDFAPTNLLDPDFVSHYPTPMLPWLAYLIRPKRSPTLGSDFCPASSSIDKMAECLSPRISQPCLRAS